MTTVCHVGRLGHVFAPVITVVPRLVESVVVSAVWMVSYVAIASLWSGYVT